jgi:predicted alpha/beta hydrolase family esterase
LEQSLLVNGHDVWLPELPNANQPSLKEWSEFVKEKCPFDIDDQTMIVGHSSGAILALVLAQQAQKPVGAITCVSVFFDNSLKWEANDKLFDIELDYDAVKKNAQTRLVIHSDNDPYVPLEQAKYVADKIDSEFLLIPGQGHFNLEKSREYAKFPRLLAELRKRQLV